MAKRKNAPSGSVARKNPGPARGVSLGARMKQVDSWREQYNPLVGLVIARARQMLEASQRGEFADLQWTYKFVEERYPVLFGLVERRTSAVLEIDWDIRTVPDKKLPPGATVEMAEAQARFLRQAYDRIDNLTDAIEHLAMATFRGYAHLQKQDQDGDGQVDHLEILDQWNWVRRGMAGSWYWNPDASQTGWTGLPAANRIVEGQDGAAPEDGAGSLRREDFIIREVKRPVGPIALIAFIRYSHAMKDYSGFLAIFGIPGGVVIGPPNVPTDKEAEYQSSGEKIAEGGTGYLPNGSDFKFNDSPRGTNPFRDFLRYQAEDVVLAGTGGLLTMLTESGSGTLAGNAHSDTFNRIGRAEAKKISERFNRDFDDEQLDKQFPGQPHLAYFQLSANEETTTAGVVDDASKLSQAGYEIDPEELSEKTGYTINRKAPVSAAVPGEPPASPITNRGRRLLNRAQALDQAFTALMNKADAAYAQAQNNQLQPLRDRLAEILKLPTLEDQQQALRALRAELPAMLARMNLHPQSAQVLMDAMASAARLGIQRGAMPQKRSSKSSNTV